MPGKRIMLASVTLEAAVDLNPITSVPWLRSWHLRGVSCLLDQRSMAPGVVVWTCTRSLGSEPGRDFPFFPLHIFLSKYLQFGLIFLNVSLSVGHAVTTGRSWSLRLAVPSAPPCLCLMAGVSPKATPIWCSRRRPPRRISWSLSSTGPTKASELPSEASIWEEEAKGWRVRRHTHTFP